jgi:alkylation response protein AidB-like acyl-CoA dehydrogenase
MSLEVQLRELHANRQFDLPFPGQGNTRARHRRLLEFGREDLSLARLAEGHLDALAILAEAGHYADPTAIYAVWASEAPGRCLRLERCSQGLQLNGSKAFCSGASLVDRALVTISVPENRLVDVDLRVNRSALTFDGTGWIASAFADTGTATVEFAGAAVACQDLIEGSGWYLERPGFWHGACGPAACWAGGAISLVDYALAQPQHDAQTLAHLGALHSQAWALRSFLDAAGSEIDESPADVVAACTRALALRHLVEQACSDVLRRFARAYGPRPLAFDRQASRCYYELDLYLRQCHAERDLESLGRRVLENNVQSSK